MAAERSVAKDESHDLVLSVEAKSSIPSHEHPTCLGRTMLLPEGVGDLDDDTDVPSRHALTHPLVWSFFRLSSFAPMFSHRDSLAGEAVHLGSNPVGRRRCQQVLLQ